MYDLHTCITQTEGTKKCGYNNIIKKSNSSNKCTMSCLHDGGIYSGRISHKNVLQVSKCNLNG